MATVTQTAGYSNIPAQAYYAERYLQTEKETLLHGAWQIIAVTPELEENGAYLSRDILGVPVIVWHIDGQYKAYIDVCPHRHSMIVGLDGSGRADNLRCPYHGWEFSPSGKVRTIPHAQCFRGLKKEYDNTLQALELERLGPFLFVRLQPGGAPLHDFLGDIAVAKILGDHEKLPCFHTYINLEIPCNWKLMFENSLEDYHTPIVHRESFGKYISLEQTNPRYEKIQGGLGCLSSFGDPNATSVNLDSDYVTIAFFSGSHYAIARQPLPFVVFDSFLPLTPVSLRRRAWVFFPEGLGEAMKTTLMGGVKQVMQEDLALLPPLQIAKKHSVTQPMLGIYEERIRFFHEYLGYF